MARGLVGHGLGFSLLATKPASNMTCDGRALVTVKFDCDVPPGRVVLAKKQDARLFSVAESFAAHCRDFFETNVFDANPPMRNSSYGAQASSSV
jgi:hypothetical protein